MSAYNKLWVWARDESRHLWARRREGASWNPWFRLESPELSTGVDTVLSGNQVIYVLAIDMNRVLQVMEFDTVQERIVNDWAPINLSGPQLWVSRPTAALYNDEFLYTHVRAADGWIWGTGTWMTGSWDVPVLVFNELRSGPVSLSWGPNRLDIFYRSDSGQLQRRYTDMGAWASQPTFYENQYDSSHAPFAVTSPFTGSHEVAMRVGTGLRILRYPR